MVQSSSIIPSSRTIPDVSNSRLLISLLKDQHGNDYIRMKNGSKVSYLRLDQARDTNLLSKRLRQVDFIALTNSKLTPVQQQIEALKPSDEALYVVHEPSWHPGTFALPDQRLVGVPDREIVVQFDRPPVSLSQAGSPRGQRRVLRRFCAGQTNFLYALSFALVGPLLELIPSYCENPFTEFCGPTSIGKTRILFVASSVWGAPLGPGTISASWDGTAIGIQDFAAARHGTLLGLDEVNKIAFGDAGQARVVAETVFKIAGGEGRIRAGSTSIQFNRLALLSTTNRPFAELVGRSENTAAGEVRCITVPADTGSGWGCWDKLPRGFETGGDASNGLLEALMADHGWIGRRWVRRLARERRQDEAGLCKKIAEYMQAYLRRAARGADGEQLRRATAFAVVYAAGQLACDLNVLPFKIVGSAIETVHDRAEAFRRGEIVADDPGSAMSVVRRYMASHADELVDLDAGPAPHMKTRELDACPGFVSTARGRRTLLVRGSRMRAMLGPTYNARLRQLQSQERLVATAGLQTQQRVRANRDKDRVYAFLVN